MNFNHLMDKKQMLIACPQRDNCKNCYWKLTGNIRASIAGNVNVSMYCKVCDAKEEVFLSENDYRMHERMLLREAKDEVSTS